LYVSSVDQLQQTTMPPVNTNKPTSSANGTNHAAGGIQIPVATIATTSNATTSIKQSPLLSSKNYGPAAIASANNLATKHPAAAAKAVKPPTSTAAMALPATATAKPAERPLSQKEKEARQKALRELSAEDEKRMRFLALLCGKNSFPSTSRERSESISRDRSGSISRDRSSSLGGGAIDDHQDDGHNTALQKALSDTTTANYAPTTPQNFSRRILHTQGCGYYDDACSLLLSAAADRFLATVLTQAKACRDRRLEGQKSLLVERRERKRHRRRVWKERIERDKRFNEDIDKRRKVVEEGKKPESNSLTTSSVSDGLTLKTPDLDGLAEFRKENADLDAEEDYYHSYYGNGDDEGKNGEEEESDDDDSDEEIDDKQYDLLLRDIVRPLGAWGFDVSSKVEFVSSGPGVDEESEYILENEDDDADQEDEEDEDADEGGDETDNDEGENGTKKPPSPAKKTSPVKKKTGVKKPATKKRKADDDASGETAPTAKKPAAATSAEQKPTATAKDPQKEPPSSTTKPVEKK
jgi:hypothetical protein